MIFQMNNVCPSGYICLGGSKAPSVHDSKEGFAACWNGANLALTAPGMGSYLRCSDRRHPHYLDRSMESCARDE